MPTIKVQRTDKNSDDKIDRYNFDIEFKSQPQKIRHINLYMSYDYFLQKKLKV